MPAAAPKATFDLNIHTHRLLSDEPFFAALSRRIDKRASTSIPTAGVMVTKEGRWEMVYNPEFFAKITEECGNTKENADNPYRWVRGILMHEFYHLIYGHCTTRSPEGGMTKTWNIAMDLAINTHIPDELPPLACIPGRSVFAKLEPGLTAEAYYKLIVEESEGKDSEQGEGGQGEGEGEDRQAGPGEGEGEGGSSSGGMGDAEPLDDHSGWGEAGEGDEGTNQQIAQERLKDMVKKAAEEANNRGWGSVSAGMKKTIMESITTKVDWRKVLRSFVKASQKASRRSTVKRINRRFPYIHAGKRAERVARVAVSIDQSGSVSDSMLAAFFAELNSLAKLAEFTVIPFDTEVAEDKVYVWKKGETRKRERVMYGGTAFNPPTEYVNARKFDGHIVLTDLCAPKPKSSKCQRMWMTTKQYAERPYFKTTERIIAIDDKC